MCAEHSCQREAPKGTHIPLHQKQHSLRYDKGPMHFEYGIPYVQSVSYSNFNIILYFLHSTVAAPLPPTLIRGEAADPAFRLSSAWLADAPLQSPTQGAPPGPWRMPCRILRRPRKDFCTTSPGARSSFPGAPHRRPIRQRDLGHVTSHMFFSRHPSPHIASSRHPSPHIPISRHPSPHILISRHQVVFCSSCLVCAFDTTNLAYSSLVCCLCCGFCSCLVLVYMIA